MSSPFPPYISILRILLENGYIFSLSLICDHVMIWILLIMVRELEWITHQNIWKENEGKERRENSGQRKDRILKFHLIKNSE